VITVNGGTSWSTWYNQPTAQFYHVTTDNRFPYWVYGAQQESGVHRHDEPQRLWRNHFSRVAFRRRLRVRIYRSRSAGLQYLYGARLTRTNQALGEIADVAPEPVRRGEYRYDRTLPVVFSPVDSKALYFAANVLFKSTDAGNSWKVISPDLARPSYETPPNLGVFAAHDPEKGKHRGVIYAVAPSFKDANTIWAGTDDGLIYITHDGGKAWANVTHLN